MTSPERALIDTRALRHNPGRVCESAPRSRVMAVVKADGYGHGMSVVADALAGADAFAVARLDEALRLREHDPEHDICLLSDFHRADQIVSMRHYRIQPVVHCEEQLALLEEDGGAGVEVWIKLNTGMNRLGFPGSNLDQVRLRLRPAMTLAARVIAVRRVARGERVGYGSTWRAERDTRVAIVACGDADGYPRHSPSGMPVRLVCRRGRLAGRVSMDTLVVAVDDDTPVAVGDEAELWGRHIPVSEVAGPAGTISYELLCRVTARVQREVTD